MEVDQMKRYIEVEALSKKIVIVFVVVLLAIWLGMVIGKYELKIRSDTQVSITEECQQGEDCEERE